MVLARDVTLGGFFPLVTCLRSVAQGSAPETPGDVKASASVAASDPQQRSVTDQTISPEEVPNRAETTSVELATLLPRKTSEQILKRIGSEIDRILPDAKSHLWKTWLALAGRPNVRSLQRLESQNSEMLRQIRSLEEELDEQLDVLRTSLGRIDEIAVVWNAADELAKTQEGVDVTIMTRIASVRGEIEDARLAVVSRRNDILAVRDKLVNPTIELDESVEQLQATIESRLQGIFRAEHPPLWSPLVRESLHKEWQHFEPKSLLQRLDENGQFSRATPEFLGFQFVLLLSVALSLRLLRNRTRARADDDDRLRHAQLVFDHPWAMALLIVVFITVPLTSHRMGILAAGAVAVATLRIVRRYLPPAMTLFAWGLALLFIIERARDLLDTTPTLERIVFLGQMLGALGLLVWLLLPSRIAKLPEERRQNPFFRLLHKAICVGAALVTLSDSGRSGRLERSGCPAGGRRSA